MGNNKSKIKGDAEWLWQSNPNPWDPKEQETWSVYSQDIITKIETSYQKKEPKCDIGEHEIVFKDMLQIHKLDPNKQRKIKRGVVNNLRSKRFVNELRPVVTVNNVFGSLNDFDRFLSTLNNKAEIDTRNAKQLSPTLSQLGSIGEIALKKIVEEAKKKENQVYEKRIQKIEECIREALYEWDGSLMMSDHRDKSIVCAFFKSYTEETFLYKIINRLLREEDWEGLKEWVPYLRILIHGFKNSSHILMSHYIEQIPPVLYRGTTLTEEALDMYDPSKHAYFSWNSFTSTSKNQNVIMNFVKTQKLQGKYSVFFEIEVGSMKEFDNRLFDLSPLSSFSEEEVLVAPGTMFEIVRKELDPTNGSCRIFLRFAQLGKIVSVPGVQLEFGKKLVEESKANLKLDGKNLMLEGNLDEQTMSELRQLLLENQTIEDLTVDVGTQYHGDNKIFQSFNEALRTVSLKAFVCMGPDPQKNILEDMIETLCAIPSLTTCMISTRASGVALLHQHLGQSNIRELLWYVEGYLDEHTIKMIAEILETPKLARFNLNLNRTPIPEAIILKIEELEAKDDIKLDEVACGQLMMTRFPSIDLEDLAMYDGRRSSTIYVGLGDLVFDVTNDASFEFGVGSSTFAGKECLVAMVKTLTSLEFFSNDTYLNSYEREKEKLSPIEMMLMIQFIQTFKEKYNVVATIKKQTTDSKKSLGRERFEDKVTSLLVREQLLAHEDTRVEERILTEAISAQFTFGKKKNTLFDERRNFAQFINQDLEITDCPKILSNCLEFVPTLVISPDKQKDFDQVNWNRYSLSY